MSDDIKAAQRELTDRVMGKPGVSGTAIGLHDGKPCLVVYLSDEDAGGALPRTVRGFPVISRVSGKFRKL